MAAAHAGCGALAAPPSLWWGCPSLLARIAPAGDNGVAVWACLGSPGGLEVCSTWVLHIACPPLLRTQGGGKAHV